MTLTIERVAETETKLRKLYADYNKQCADMVDTLLEVEFKQSLVELEQKWGFTITESIPARQEDRYQREVLVTVPLSFVGTVDSPFSLELNFFTTTDANIFGGIAAEYLHVSGPEGIIHLLKRSSKIFQDFFTELLALYRLKREIILLVERDDDED